MARHGREAIISHYGLGRASGHALGGRRGKIEIETPQDQRSPTDRDQILMR